MFVAKTSTLNKIKNALHTCSPVLSASLLAGSFTIAFDGIHDFYGSQHKLAHLVCPCVLGSFIVQLFLQFGFFGIQIHSLQRTLQRIINKSGIH